MASSLLSPNRAHRALTQSVLPSAVADGPFEEGREASAAPRSYVSRGGPWRPFPTALARLQYAEEFCFRVGLRRFGSSRYRNPAMADTAWACRQKHVSLRLVIAREYRSDLAFLWSPQEQDIVSWGD